MQLKQLSENSKSRTSGFLTNEVEHLVSTMLTELFSLNNYTKLISSLCRPKKTQLVGFSLSDAMVDCNKHSCEWAETWMCRKWLNSRSSAARQLRAAQKGASCQLESGNWWEVYIGNEDVCVCIWTQLPFTYARFMSNQNGPSSCVYLCHKIPTDFRNFN